MSNSLSDRPVFLHTAGAMVLAPVVWILVAFVVGAILSIWNKLMTVMRPEIIDFFAALVSAAVGMWAAQAVCEKLIKNYAGRPVFAIFFVFAVGQASAVLLVIEEPAAPITVLAQSLAILIAAYVWFWRVARS